MFSRILICVLLAIAVGCGTSRQVVTVSTISQPHIAGLGFPSDCLSENEPSARCKGDRIVVSGPIGQEQVVQQVKSEILSGRYHQLVDETDPSLTVHVSVESSVPEYRIQRTRQHFPKQCIEREEQCWSTRELNGCLQKANQGRDSVTVDRMRSACRQRHRRCRFVCVTYRKAYTTYKVDEVCTGTVQLDVVRFMDREGDAVGSQSGLTLGSPLLKGTSTSSRSQNDAQPTEVGEARLCQYAVENAVKKSRRYLSPFEIDVQLVFADLALVAYQGAINQIRFGRFKSAHQELDAAFESAEVSGLPSEDVAWIHHVKAAVFQLQGQDGDCLAHLEHASRLRPSLLSEYTADQNGYVSPEGHFKRLMLQCGR